MMSLKKLVLFTRIIGAQNVFSGLLMVILYAHVKRKTHVMHLDYADFHRNQRKFRSLYILLFVVYSLTVYSRIQIGLWDGSIESGTAQWSRGPIDVSGSSMMSLCAPSHICMSISGKPMIRFLPISKA